MGHWAKDCRSKAKKAGQAHLAEEEEGGLLLAEAEITLAPSPAVAPSPPLGVVHLLVEKVVPNLGGVDERSTTRWVVDTGATNHMSGASAAFSDLDTGVCGTVKFGDGSIVRIEGCGTVLFCCKNGEHKAFTSVYYIPKLKTNIISVGQLDEIGFQTLTEDGIMHIRDTDRRLLAKIPRAHNRLYVLNATLARPVCLTARAEEDAWRWHARLGHLNFSALKKMANEDWVRGMPQIRQVNQLCDG